MSNDTQFLDIAESRGIPRKIAYLHDSGTDPAVPGIFWLSGFKSDMLSTKVSAIEPWAKNKGAAFTRFDYSGHGQSSGGLEEFTIGDWLAESLAVLERFTEGPQIIIGSSMGGWLALLLARALRQRPETGSDRLRALILIAPAWDMTEELMWTQFAEAARRELMENGVFYRPSDYGEPYAITRALIEEGRNHLLAGSVFDPGCPVRILQGMRDPDVPWEHSMKLMGLLGAEDMRMTLVKDGEHRMSRDQDLKLLLDTIGEFMP